MKMLFIGGCRDGEWVEVEPHHGSVTISKPMIASFADPFITPEKRLKIDHYNRQLFRVQDEDVYLMVVEGLPILGAFNRLLHHYKP